MHPDITLRIRGKESAFTPHSAEADDALALIFNTDYGGDEDLTAHEMLAIAKELEEGGWTVRVAGVA